MVVQLRANEYFALHCQLTHKMISSHHQDYSERIRCNETHNVYYMDCEARKDQIKETRQKCNCQCYKNNKIEGFF